MKILISPINDKEALAAAEGGADIIDLKNVLEGSLGANFPWVIQSVLRRLRARKVAFSAAIGDLDNKPGTAALAARGAASCGVDYVKAGIYGARDVKSARAVIAAFSRAARDVNRDVIPVAAGYGDYRSFGGLSPLALVAAAKGTGVGMVMLDTAIKNGESLFDGISIKEAQAFIDGAHRAGLKAALAGSLTSKHLEISSSLGADVIGVRGAVCAGADRRASIQKKLVQKLVQEVRRLSR